MTLYLHGFGLPCLDANSACTHFFAGVKLLSMMSPEELPDDVALVGVGSGLTWSSYLVRFDGPAESRGRWMGSRCVE